MSILETRCLGLQKLLCLRSRTRKLDRKLEKLNAALYSLKMLFNFEI